MRVQLCFHVVNDLPEDTDLLSYCHEVGLNALTYEKNLTYYDINTGFLMISYEDFGASAFDKEMTTLLIVDDYGNLWNCILIYGSFPYKHFKIGGEWKRMVAARRIAVGDRIKLQCDRHGRDEFIFLTLDH
ncbi:hypothetical protein TSUD_377140 [Trifolium subterraneum]|uniref:TF-B3 domain-containing protein n=1 Tax=Trifolium subterraneum TaxID=3900 RepID=A0A2Z6MBK1_TRISU|nr:hypothetical protein TSUD_377140 [Trifolium subterraneum]